jgi:hypothetical protein
MTQILPATVEHFDRLKGALPMTARAFAVVRGEDVLGIGGVYRDGAIQVMFSELTDELRRDKRSLIRLIRSVKALLRPRAQAFADPEIKGSEALLEHMGFEPLVGRVYQWPG